MTEKRGVKIRRVAFSVSGMDCVTCALAVGKRLKKMEGIEEVGSAIMLNKVFVDYDDSKVGIAEIKKAIKDAGYSNYVVGYDP